MDKSSLRIENLNSIYAELANLVGLDVALEIHKHYNGQQVTFPSRLYSKSFVESEIKRRYDGSNIKALAKEFGYTERWTRSVAKGTKTQKTKKK